MMKNQTVYHYTNKLNLKKILRDRAILSSPGFTEWEKPTVWLSTTPHWENSASSIARNRDGSFRKRSIHEVGNLGMARIKIDLEKTRVFTIQQFKNISRISTRNLKRLNEFALECKSNINDWRVSFSDIPLESWEKVEVFDDFKKIWTDFKIDRKDYLELMEHLVGLKDLIPVMTSEQKKELNCSLNLIEENLTTHPHNRFQG